MITAVLVDDKTVNTFILQELLTEYCPNVQVLCTANNAEEAYKSIIKLRPDLLFLDIEMPGGSGFDLLQRFDKLSFDVIFVTAYDQYAIRAFRENALDYLLKPIEIAALQAAVIKAETQKDLKQTQQNISKFLLQKAQPNLRKISISMQDGLLFLNTDEVIRCEASGSYSWFFMTDGKKIVASMRLKECEEILPAHTFFRVHHSHIINLNFVNKYVRGRGGSILMQDGSTVEVAAAKKTTLLELLEAGNV